LFFVVIYMINFTEIFKSVLFINKILHLISVNFLPNFKIMWVLLQQPDFLLHKVKISGYSGSEKIQYKCDFHTCFGEIGPHSRGPE
jgi:hypothetical protein